LTFYLSNGGKTVSERSQMTLSLTNEAIAVLEKHTTQRKRGEFISNLLAAYGDSAGAISQADIESLKLQMLGLTSTQKTFEGRLLRVEQKLAQLK
jgi:hypothetical protein